MTLFLQSTGSQAKGMKLGGRTTSESKKTEEYFAYHRYTYFYLSFVAPSSFSASSKALAPSSPSSGTGGEGDGDGWDFDDAGWGSFDTAGSKTSSAGTGSSSSSAKQDQQKRREERRLKQQAAREKRAAGMALKPGLGAVKKD